MISYSELRCRTLSDIYMYNMLRSPIDLTDLCFLMASIHLDLGFDHPTHSKLMKMVICRGCLPNYL